jgi:NAD(P)-dependent dehydrogenase (short-subunit alcohol dehydrogenase family)
MPAPSAEAGWWPAVPVPSFFVATHALLEWLEGMPAWLAYGRAKSANILFGVEADRRGVGQGIRAFAVHPGGVFTDIVRFMTAQELIDTGTTDERGNAIVHLAAGPRLPSRARPLACGRRPALG